MILWDVADAKTGVATMTVTRLAKTLATNRQTAARCLRVLQSMNLIKPYIRADGTTSKGRWEVRHLTKDE